MSNIESHEQELQAQNTISDEIARLRKESSTYRGAACVVGSIATACAVVGLSVDSPGWKAGLLTGGAMYTGQAIYDVLQSVNLASEANALQIIQAQNPNAPLPVLRSPEQQQ